MRSPAPQACGGASKARNSPRPRAESPPARAAANLVVHNLSWDVDDDALRALFAPHGDIRSVTVQWSRASRSKTGLRARFGFVAFDDEAAAGPVRVFWPARRSWSCARATSISSRLLPALTSCSPRSSHCLVSCVSVRSHICSVDPPRKCHAIRFCASDSASLTDAFAAAFCSAASTAFLWAAWALASVQRLVTREGVAV